MGLLDDYTSGIGSPRPKWQHQNVIRRALVRTYDELAEQGLCMLSEATVTNDWDDLAPDLVIFNKRNEPLTIIEITTHKECRAIIRKCHELIARFPNAEYFVFDYEKSILYAFDHSDGEWVTSMEYEISSRFLELPLIEYLL